MSHVRGDVRKHGGEAEVCENCRPLLDAITAERDEALRIAQVEGGLYRSAEKEVTRLRRSVVQANRKDPSRYDYLTQLSRAEKAEAKVAALREQIDRVKALRDEWNPKPEQSSTVLWDELNAALDGDS